MKLNESEKHPENSRLKVTSERLVHVHHAQYFIHRNTRLDISLVSLHQKTPLYWLGVIVNNTYS